MNEHYMRGVGEQGVRHLITTARIHALPDVGGIRVLHTLLNVKRKLLDWSGDIAG
jgi:hypothetical protein